GVRAVTISARGQERLTASSRRTSTRGGPGQRTSTSGGGGIKQAAAVALEATAAAASSIVDTVSTVGAITPGGSKRKMTAQTLSLQTLALPASGLSVKAAEMMGDDELRKVALEAVPVQAVVSPKVLEALGEAGKLADPKARKQLGDDMTAAQLAEQVRAEREERAAVEARVEAERLRVLEAVLQATADSSVAAALPGLSSKAAGVMGDAALEKAALEAVPVHAVVSPKVLEALGEAGKLADVKARKQLGEEMTAHQVAEMARTEREERAAKAAAAEAERLRALDVALHTAVELTAASELPGLSHKAAGMLGDAALEKAALEAPLPSVVVNKKALVLMGTTAVLADKKVRSLLGEDTDATMG
ncbi:unnamed protein product, partial [Phaeothamnion confervicola]